MRKLLLLLIIFPALLAFDFSWASSHSFVVINEFVPHPSSGSDWIELYNLSGSDVDISGWKIADSTGDVKTLPSGVIIEGDDPDGNNFYYFTVSNRLNNGGDSVKLYDSSTQLIDEKAYASDPGIDYAYVRYPDGSDAWFVTTQPTQSAKNIYQAPQSEEEEPQQPQPALAFSAPSSVVADTSFSVSVELSNFDLGTYRVRGLIGKEGSSMCDGKTLGLDGNWGSCTGTYGSWNNMPLVNVPSSGLVSLSIQVKTDEEIEPGAYLLQIKAVPDEDRSKATFSSQLISVSAKPQAVESSEEETGEPDDTPVGEAGLPPDEVSGEGSSVLGVQQRKEVFRPNFYLGVGIFGVLVGLGGIAYALRGFWLPSLQDYLETLKSKGSEQEVEEE